MMIKEPTPDNQDTQPHSYALDQTQPHPVELDDTQPRQPSLDDLQPGRRVAKVRRRVTNFRALVIKTALIAMGVIALLAGMYLIAPPPRLNILLLGVDARSKEGWTARSDSMMLITVDPRRMYMGMLSIPRDLFVDIPGYVDNRINTAHILGEQAKPGGGPELAARTIEHNFGVPVQRTIRLKFDGFVQIIDAAGGVDINVPKRIVDSAYPTPDYYTTTVVFEPGYQHMDGQRALVYVRTRHADSDFNRAQRQQAMISALLNKLLSPNGWAHWPGVYLAMTQNVETNLTLFDALAYAPVILWVGPGGIDGHDLGNGLSTSYRSDAGASLLAPHWDLINPLIVEMFGE